MLRSKVIACGFAVLLSSAAIAQQTYSITDPTAPNSLNDDCTVGAPLIVSGQYFNWQFTPTLKLWRQPNAPNGGWFIETHGSIATLELEEDPGMPGSGDWEAELWNNKNHPDIEAWTPSPSMPGMPWMIREDHKLEIENFDTEQYYKVI